MAQYEYRDEDGDWLRLNAVGSDLSLRTEFRGIYLKREDLTTVIAAMLRHSGVTLDTLNAELESIGDSFIYGEDISSSTHGKKIKR